MRDSWTQIRKSTTQSFIPEADGARSHWKEQATILSGDYPLRKEWDILGLRDILQEEKLWDSRIVVLTPDSMKRHSLVIISCIWLPCIQTTGNHSLLFNNQASVLLLSLHTHLSPLPIAPSSSRDTNYLPLVLILHWQHLSSFFPPPPTRSSIKFKLSSKAYQLELCCLTFNINMPHPQSQLSMPWLVSLPSSILCLHDFGPSPNSFQNYPPSTAPFSTCPSWIIQPL